MLKWPAVVLLSLYWLSLFISTHTPPEQTPSLPNHLDKVAHLGAYAVLAFLICLGVQLQSRSGRRMRFLSRTSLMIFGVCAIYGLVDELLQLIVDRDCSVADWAADCVGAVLGIGLFVIVINLYDRFRDRGKQLQARA